MVINMEKNTSVPFEKSLEELENLVAKMETGRLPLEELIVGFERGNALIKQCRNKLDTLERKIEILTREDAENTEWSDFDSTFASCSEKDR